MKPRINSGIGQLVVDLCRRIGAIESRPSREAEIVTSLNDEAAQRASGDRTSIAQVAQETDARIMAVKAVADSVIAEANRAKSAENALQDRSVPLSGTLVLAAGLSIGVGKTSRMVAVQGLKKGDVVAISPGVALPGNLSLGDAYCRKDGELTLAMTVSGIVALSITASVSIPLAIRALR